MEEQVSRLEDLVRETDKSLFFKEIVQFARDFALPKDRAELMVEAGKFNKLSEDLMFAKSLVDEEKIETRIGELAKQCLLTVYKVSQRPNFPEAA